MNIEDVRIKEAPEGFHLANEKVVNAIRKGLARNDGKCPCHHEKEWTDEQLICLCEEFRTTGHCCCGLYVKD